jgi:hypothetical protein
MGQAMFEESKTPVFDALMVLAREHALPTTPAALREIYEVLVELRSRELPQAAKPKSTTTAGVDSSPCVLGTKLCRGCGIMLTGEVTRSSPTALDVCYCRNCWNRDLQIEPLVELSKPAFIEIMVQPDGSAYWTPIAAPDDGQQAPSPPEEQATVPADRQCGDCQKFIPHGQLVATDICGKVRCSECWDIVCSGPTAAN